MIRTSQLNFSSGPNPDPAYQRDTKRKLISMVERSTECPSSSVMSSFLPPVHRGQSLWRQWAIVHWWTPTPNLGQRALQIFQSHCWTCSEWHSKPVSSLPSCWVWMGDLIAGGIVFSGCLSVHLSIGTILCAERWCCRSRLLGCWAQSWTGPHSATVYQHAGTHFADLRMLTGGVKPTWY